MTGRFESQNTDAPVSPYGRVLEKRNELLDWLVHQPHREGRRDVVIEALITRSIEHLHEVSNDLDAYRAQVLPDAIGGGRDDRESTPDD